MPMTMVLVDYNFETIDTTGLEGYPVNAYAYLYNGLPLIHVSIPMAAASTVIFPDRVLDHLRHEQPRCLH